ncbi:MAG: glycosyltransferase family 4 protein [Thermodesulfobacteriota bacterium]
MVLNNKPKVDILTQYFYPDVATTGQLLTELAVDLVKQGSKVGVITGFPSYSGKKVTVADREDFKGIQIRRIQSTKFNKNTKLGRILNSLSFFISTLFFTFFCSDGKATLLIVSNPPFLPLVGLFYKFLRRQKFIFLVHDVYPDIAIRLGYLKEFGIISTLWHFMNRWVYKKADKVIVLGDYMKETLLAKWCDELKSNKIVVIHNWTDEEFIKPLDKSENEFAKKHDLTEKIVIQYSGNLGLFQDLETLIYAAEGLRRKNMFFLFIGDGGKKNKLERMVKDMQLENVMFLPYQPLEVVPYSLTCSDISIVTLERGAEGLGVPSKTYSILASGRPILALVEERCEVAEIISSYNCGFRVDPGDVEGVVRVLTLLYYNQQLIKELGEKARLCFEQNFTRSIITKQYFDLFLSL